MAQRCQPVTMQLLPELIISVGPLLTPVTVRCERRFTGFDVELHRGPAAVLSGFNARGSRPVIRLNTASVWAELRRQRRSLLRWPGRFHQVPPWLSPGTTTRPGVAFVKVT